jgi:glycosyltransferase involved in cell wall biosynthesis
MKKIKILVIPSDRTGVGAHRSLTPHITLENQYPDLFSVDIDYEPQLDNDEFLKQYDIIHYHRTIGPFENVESVLNRAKNLGVVTIMDIDDYWAPGNHHPAYLLIKNSGMDKKIEQNLRIAHNITTTTPIFAKEISKYNKNVFVLPNAIDETEPQFIPNPTKSEKLRIAWLGGSCMTPDTEILTDNGWKRFDKLDQTEKVATLNPKTNELEYNKPTGYICTPFDGYLNCGKNGLIEYEVTPNHNMYASEAKSITSKKLNLELIQSEKIHGKNFHVKKNAIWYGKEEKYFLLPKLIQYCELEEESYVDKLIKSKRINKHNENLFDKYGSDRLIDMDSWLEFFGFWMAEGWTSKTKGIHQVGIAQTKDNGYLDHMFNLLTKMGFKPTFTKDKKQLRVFDKQLWDYLSNFGDAPAKFIPREIMELSTRQLSIFLNWFIKGDGHIENNKYNRTRAFTSSITLANDLQEIALKIGISATITNRGKRTSHINGRPIKNQFDSLVINFTKHPSISKHNKNTPLIKTDNQYQRPYKGNVYCVEVKNHIIYVRRNGKAMWIGNSHLKDLEILRGLVNRLKTDKLLDKLQFVLCGFDLRGTHTEIDKNTGEQRQRPITPKESVWYHYEKIFTDDYKSVSPEYKDFLFKFVQQEYENVENEPYRRVWTKHISSYATNYNLFDISLAPLEENIFNHKKSQLKVIESGFHKKAIIAQNYGPYQIDLINVFKTGGKINENGNAILIDSDRNHSDWYKAIKRLINNPEVIEIMKNNLHNLVKERYEINVVNENRKNLYLSLINNNKN